jgi:hypothetical protein
MTLLALHDLAQAKDWLKQPGSGTVAHNRLRQIRAAIGQLKVAPCRWPEGEHPSVREIPVAGYRVMYEIHPDTGDDKTAGDVWVLRVFGPRQLRTRL